MVKLSKCFIMIRHTMIKQFFVSFRGHMIFSQRHTVVSVFKMAKSTCSTNVLSDYSESPPENCSERNVKNRKDKINDLKFYTT